MVETTDVRAILQSDGIMIFTSIRQKYAVVKCEVVEIFIYYFFLSIIHRLEIVVFIFKHKRFSYKISNVNGRLVTFFLIFQNVRHWSSVCLQTGFE